MDLSILNIVVDGDSLNVVNDLKSSINDIYLMENANYCSGELVKKTNIVKFSWKLCNQSLKNEKGIVFYA
jgi:hypothetical protein